MTPRFRAQGDIETLEVPNSKVLQFSLDLCCVVPIIRNSVFDGFRVNLLDENQM